MPMFLGMGAISAAGSLFGGLFGGNASQQAAQQYEQALQKGVTSLQGNLQTGEANYQPYLNAGQGATNTLASLMGTPGQGLMTPWSQQFTAPTAAQAAQTPGYQFQLQQGENAAQNSAAGQGSLLSGRTLASLNDFAQGTASTNYQNTFNNSLTQYNSAYNSFLNNQQNQYSRLMGMSGQGLQAANGEGQLIQGIGGDIASLYGQQGAAKAQGTIGAANAYGSIIPGMANGMMNGMTLSMLNGGTQNQGPMTNFDSSTWMGTPSYMPGGGPSPAAPFTGLNLPAGSSGAAPTF
jgi:hypothetical protein